MGLSNIQRFHCLRSCLGDKSLKIIESLGFAAQNYNNVCKLLCDRFDNSQLIVPRFNPRIVLFTEMLQQIIRPMFGLQNGFLDETLFIACIPHQNIEKAPLTTESYP